MWKLLFFASVLLAACGDLFSPDDTDSPKALSYAQETALVKLFAMPAIGSSRQDALAEQSPPLDYTPLSTVNCTPQKLFPVQNCPNGGNIYYTVNLSCTGPSLCCGNDPPCSKDGIRIQGQGDTIYNSCTTVTEDGDRIVVNGTLHSGIDSNTEFACSGVFNSLTKITVNGMPTVRVNGIDRCPGLVNITATATVNTSVFVSVTGSACGKPITRFYDEGCMVSCSNDRCCPGGTYCSTCTTGCVPAGKVDCCNGKVCPAGTTCDTANDRCTY